MDLSGLAPDSEISSEFNQIQRPRIISEDLVNLAVS